MEVQSTDLSGIKIYMYTNPKKVRISASDAITHSKRQTLRERKSKTPNNSPKQEPMRT